MGSEAQCSFFKKGDHDLALEIFFVFSVTRGGGGALAEMWRP
jgi:hypothetical protein